jgi:hypothetical protein
VHGARVGVDDGRVGDRLGVAVLLGHGCGCEGALWRDSVGMV